MSMNGIITIDGLDGSGKETLAKEVVRLLNEDYNAEYKAFPDYYNKTGELIKKYLGGEIPLLNKIPYLRKPYIMSELFILNRYEYFNSENLNLELDKNIYVFDRYWISNVLYQAHGMSTEQIAQFINWLAVMEFDYYKNPRPSFSVFLRVPYSVLRDRLAFRTVNKNGQKNDIYEEDNFLKTTYHVSEELIKCPNEFGNCFNLILDGWDFENQSPYPVEYLARIIVESFKAWQKDKDKEAVKEANNGGSIDE